MNPSSEHKSIISLPMILIYTFGVAALHIFLKLERRVKSISKMISPIDSIEKLNHVVTYCSQNVCSYCLCQSINLFFKTNYDWIIFSIVPGCK